MIRKSITLPLEFFIRFFKLLFLDILCYRNFFQSFFIRNFTLLFTFVFLHNYSVGSGSGCRWVFDPRPVCYLEHRVNSTAITCNVKTQMDRHIVDPDPGNPHFKMEKNK